MQWFVFALCLFAITPIPFIVQAIAKWKGNPPEIPVVIGGQEYHTGNVQSQVSVSIHLITVSSSQGVCSQFVPLLSTL